MPLAFRQFLMTNFLSAEFILAFWRANLKISAKCRVQGAVFNAEIFSAVQKALPSRKLPFHHSPIAIRYSLPFCHSLLAVHHSLPFYQSPVAIRHSLPFFPTCRFADLTIYRKLGSAEASPSRLIPSCVPLSEKLDGD
jgi:hypothetical protein